MRLGQIMRLLNLWVKAGLISNGQSDKIAEYMKAQRHQQMLKFIKVLFVLGAFWLVVGFIATVKLIDARILLAVWNFICGIFTPVVNWAFELWIANLLFLGAALGAMFYGAFKEDRLYFNFGLTFFIIDTYTLFFSRVWATLGTAVGSLFLGVLLVVTGYALRRVLLQNKIFKNVQ